MSNMRCLAFIHCCCTCIPIATDPQAQLPNSTFLLHKAEPRPPSRWSIPHPRLPRRHQPIRSIPRWIRHPSRRWVCPPILPSHSFHRPGPLHPVSRLLAPSFLVRLSSMSPHPVVIVIESSPEDRGADSSHRADRRWLAWVSVEVPSRPWSRLLFLSIPYQSFQRRLSVASSVGGVNHKQGRFSGRRGF